MKKDEIFTFTAPNGVEVTAVVITEWPDNTPLIYAQNKIAFFNCVDNHIGGVLVDYAILPEYDAMLEDYQRDIDMENASTIQPWEEEFERELQGCNDKYLITL